MWKDVNDRRAYNREYYQRVVKTWPEKIMFRSARTRAKNAGIEFSIDMEDIVIPSHCPVLGIPLFVGTHRSKYNSPSLDRIDNNKGYTKDNIAVISMKANLHKADLSKEQIKALHDYVFRLEQPTA